MSFKRDWQEDITRGFYRTRHKVEFGSITPESFGEFDLVVPLTIADLIQVRRRCGNLVSLVTRKFHITARGRPLVSAGSFGHMIAVLYAELSVPTCPGSGRIVPGIPPRSPTLSYRADIDGLRGIAVLLVLGDHLNTRALRGGFIGVDVFFVISGFLISSVILGQISASKFSLRTFYERRDSAHFPGPDCHAFHYESARVLLPLTERALGFREVAFGGNFFGFEHLLLETFGILRRPLRDEAAVTYVVPRRRRAVLYRLSALSGLRVQAFSEELASVGRSRSSGSFVRGQRRRGIQGPSADVLSCADARMGTALRLHTCAGGSSGAFILCPTEYCGCHRCDSDFRGWVLFHAFYAVSRRRRSGSVSRHRINYRSGTIRIFHHRTGPVVPTFGIHRANFVFAVLMALADHRLPRVCYSGAQRFWPA